jgi:YVTN family beta-propeller protein
MTSLSKAIDHGVAGAGRRGAVLLAVLLAFAACGSPSPEIDAGSRAPAAAADLVYVLDAAALAETSSVVVVDAATGDVVREYPAGRDPAMALSPDGTRLFLASRWGDEASQTDRLDLIDTATGEVVRSVPLEHRWANTLPAYFPTIEVSEDGRWVHVLQTKVLGGDSAEYSVATVNAQNGQALPENAATPGCGAAWIRSPAGSPRVDLVCHSGHEVRFVTLSNRGSSAAAERVALPKHDDDPPGDPEQDLALWQLGGGVASPDGRSIYAAMQNGYVSVVDAGSHRVRETVDLELGDDAHVAFGDVTVSPAGDRLYLGVGSTGAAFNRLSADRILAFDTTTWEQVAEITPSESFESIAVSPSGRYLYVVDTESASVLVLDAQTNEEVRVISGIGKTPTLAEVAATG